jgi:hypothetical protein
MLILERPCLEPLIERCLARVENANIVRCRNRHGRGQTQRFSSQGAVMRKVLRSAGFGAGA